MIKYESFKVSSFLLKFILTVIFLTSASISPPTWSQSYVSPHSDCFCKTTPQDPFDTSFAFNSGPFKGRCVDSCRYRPARILSQSTTSLHISNILHKGVYYSTKIPMSHLIQASVGFERFRPSLFHVFLKFDFNKKLPALHLIPTIPGHTHIKTHQLILSSEAVPPQSEQFSFIHSLIGRYPIVHRVTTAEEFQYWAASKNHPVEFFPLKVTQVEIQKAFRKAIDRSHSSGLQDRYKLFTNNCVTSALGFFEWDSSTLGISYPLSIDAPWSTKASLLKSQLIDQKGLTWEPTFQ